MTRSVNKPVVGLVLAAAFVIGFAAGSGRLWDFDLWWHLKTGQLIVERLAVPHQDPFSYTRAGAPWVAHEWAWDAALALVYRAGGYLGLLYFKALLAGVCSALAAALALRWGGGLLASLGATTLMSVAVGVWLNARPQMLLVLYALLLLWLWQAWRAGRPRALWWLPVIFLFWANTHGAFLLGWGMLALFALCAALQPRPGDLRRSFGPVRLGAVRPLVLPGLLSVAVCLLNPSGVAGFLYPFSYVVGANAYHAQVITEYASPDFHNGLFLLLGLLMLLTLLALVLSPRTPDLLEIVLLFVGVLLFLRWARNGPLLAAFCVPLLARHLTERAALSRAWRCLALRELPLGSVRPGVLVIGAGVLLVALLTLAPRSGAVDRALADNVLPVAATEWIAAHSPSGPLLNTYEWGGYLIWRLWPAQRVYIDGRADMYGNQMLDEYLRATKLKPGWRGVLESRDLQWALLRTDSALALILTEEGRFAEVYRDEQAVVLVRRGGLNSALIGASPAGEARPGGEAPSAGLPRGDS